MTRDWRHECVDTIREWILAADADIVEEAKWKKPSNPDGVPTFSLDGLICTLETYKDKVKITFARGASIDDPGGIFNASLDAGTRRAVDVFEGDEVDQDGFSQLVERAIVLNRA